RTGTDHRGGRSPRHEPRRARPRLRRLLHHQGRWHRARALDRPASHARSERPAPDRDRPGLRDQSRHRAARGRGRRYMTLILVVDDVPAMAEQYAYDLRRIAGYEVIVAGDGRQALERLGGEGGDCILLDLEMPG